MCKVTFNGRKLENSSQSTIEKELITKRKEPHAHLGTKYEV